MSENSEEKKEIVLKGVIPPKRRTPEEINEAMEHLTKNNNQLEKDYLSLTENLKGIMKEHEQTSFSSLSEKIKEIIKEYEQHPDTGKKPVSSKGDRKRA
jgi:archaellum component FlaC